MAINKKQASKSSGNSKKATAKKVVSAKKAIPTKKATPAKKAAPVKKATPAKKAAPAKKTVTVKKAAPAKKAVTTKKSMPIKKAPPTKKNSAAKAVPAKKIAPAKKAAPLKKVAPVKKAAPVKKVAPVKKAAPVAKKAIKQEPVIVAPKKEPVEKKPAKPVKKTISVAKTTKILKSIVNNSSGTPVHPSKPTPAPVGRSLRDDKKPQIIVAHRRLHKDNKQEEESNTIAKTNFTEFNRSLLDEQPAPATAARRYSDEDLNEFRDIINGRLDNARKELTYLQGLIMRKDSAGTEDSENRFNVEDGSGAMERETVSQLASRQIQFISNLEKALIRVENKTYGVCRVTGKLIDKARLRAVPHATLSIEAKTGLKK
jgi:RNA polymerase-binding transcription factor DksA